MLEQRATLLDSSLFVGSAVRNKELLDRFGLTGAGLVNLAITHEMGHGICHEKRERQADDYGKDLRDGKVPDCSNTPGWKPTSVAANTSSSAPSGPQR